ncbi:hypothetical protein COSO111634_38510 [Corallococcus soli]
MPPLRTSSATADGTVFSNVTRPASFSPASASAFSATTTVPPLTSGAKTSNTDKSKFSDVAASTPFNCSALKVAVAHFRKATALACVTATPFGRPVLPDVYSTYANWLGTLLSLRADEA